MDARELEVLGTGAGSDVDDAGSLVQRDLVPRDDPMHDPLLCGEVVERPLVLETDELLPAHAGLEVLIRISGYGDPLAHVVAPVFRIRPHSGGDVRGQRPGSRRPDHERLARPPTQREADEERGMLELGVVLLARLLVLRERGAAARTPLRRTVSLVQPAARVHLLEEAPDVLDVRVAEGVVRVVPVHPHAEPLRLLGLDARVMSDAFLAALGELGEAVALDLALRIEAERLLHLDLDVQPLRIEAVLVAEVVAPLRLVALEDVLQRPPVAVVDARRVVRRDRPIHEREDRAAAVLLPEPGERAFLVPASEHLPLERGMVGFVRHRLEDWLRHREAKSRLRRSDLRQRGYKRFLY